MYECYACQKRASDPTIDGCELPTMLFPGIELRTSGKAASTLSYRAISPALQTTSPAALAAKLIRQDRINLSENEV